ncbi:MAG: hypothetical protein QOI59_144 [Gammaproteobacteria bacterium]|nr:hypothetical protein [Gammaproteobacteria bacterium]
MSPAARTNLTIPGAPRPSWFQRFLLPGLAFKAVVIGGGYATGRELAEFFIPSGPWGGIAGMLLAMMIWSCVCVVTFLFARLTHTLDYRSFFKELLGRFAFLFEFAYFAYVIVVLAVFGAAAGSLGLAVFGWPLIYGTLCLIAGIAVFTTFGSTSVEQLFKWVSLFLYAVYTVFFVLALVRFGARIPTSFAINPVVSGWAARGTLYAGYNILGAVVILPVVRHFSSNRDVITAGLLCGPLAMLPALIFFICMCAFYPQIGAETLPSDFMLRQLNLPVFQITFQLMIFAALLESGTGAVHAVNERLAATFRSRRSSEMPNAVRLLSAAALLIGSIFIANQFGLVALISRGYRALACLILALYVAPLMTYGAWRVMSGRRHHSGSLQTLGS